MRTITFLCGTLGLTLAGVLSGWASTTANHDGLATSTALPKAPWSEAVSSGNTQPDDGANRLDLSALAFLEGEWRMTRENGDVCEETWSGADTGEDGASLMGMFRWIGASERGGASKFVEIMTMREEHVNAKPTLVYRLRHFGMDLSPWEDSPIVLHVTEAGNNRMLMLPPEGSATDVVSIEYRLVDENLVCDAVFNHGGEHDQLGFVFERID